MLMLTQQSVVAITTGTVNCHGRLLVPEADPGGGRYSPSGAWGLTAASSLIKASKPIKPGFVSESSALRSSAAELPEGGKLVGNEASNGMWSFPESSRGDARV